MGYSYPLDDSSGALVGGTVASLVYGGCIQEDDGYGGTNHSFSIPGKTGVYHVHFNSTGRKVNVVRYKSSHSDAKGTNIVKWFDDSSKGTQKKNLKGLAQDCSAYPNHQALLNNLSEAIGAK